VGEIGEKAAGEFGLPKGCVVAGGLHDQPSGILGAGVLPGESMLATGTVICLGILLKDKPKGRAMAENNLCYYPTVGERQYVSLAYNFTGGSLLRWYRDNLAGQELVEAKSAGVDPYEMITEGLPDQPTGILVLPHFTTTGTPWLDPKGLGAVFGLRLTTGRKEIVKAILEGILYEIRLNAELLRDSGVEIELYKAIGGAAKSRTWMQIAADILDAPVAITKVTEGAGLGAALLGAKAAGVLKSTEEIHGIVKQAAQVERVLEPRPEHARKYAERFEIYKDLYPATRTLSHRIFALTASS
jgi:xylulokinase